MMKKFLAIYLFSFSLYVFSQDLSFKREGKLLETVSLSAIRTGNLNFKNGSIHASNAKIFNVFRGYEKTYGGYNLFQVLDLVYGKDWKLKNKIIFNSIDGYHQISLIKKLLSATQNKTGLIAFTENDRIGFTEIIKDGKKVDPAPLYLVWTNFSNADKASHADTIKWPYQLIEINIE